MNQLSVSYELRPVPPFRLDLTAWALRRDKDNVVDRWDGETYRRILAWEDKRVEIAVTPKGALEEPCLEITATGEGPISDTKNMATEALNRLLGIQVDLAEFYRFALRDQQLELLVRRFGGVKPPRFPTVFEAVVNGIACQQISLIMGIRLLNLLCEAYGPTMQSSGNLAYAFPRPEDLATLQPEALRELGFSRQKAEAIIGLAAAVARGFNLEQLTGVDDEEVMAVLCKLRGVGRWTAEYVLLRGLGRLHIFPGDDVGARNKLRRWLGLNEALDYEEIRHVIAPWSPYAGMIYLHLLLDHLTGLGYLP